MERLGVSDVTLLSSGSRLKSSNFKVVSAGDSSISGESGSSVNVVPPNNPGVWKVISKSDGDENKGD